MAGYHLCWQLDVDRQGVGICHAAQEQLCCGLADVFEGLGYGGEGRTGGQGSDDVVEAHKGHVTRHTEAHFGEALRNAHRFVVVYAKNGRWALLLGQAEHGIEYGP